MGETSRLNSTRNCQRPHPPKNGQCSATAPCLRALSIWCAARINAQCCVTMHISKQTLTQWQNCQHIATKVHLPALFCNVVHVSRSRAMTNVNPMPTNRYKQPNQLVCDVNATVANNQKFHVLIYTQPKPQQPFTSKKKCRGEWNQSPRTAVWCPKQFYSLTAHIELLK